MPVKLIPQIRFFTNSFPTMKPNPTLHSSSSMSVLSRVFPFRLKYQNFGRGPSHQLGIRRLSTRPLRAVSTRSSSSEFTRNRDRGDSRRGGGGKSLIDDEAELSDWVSDLKTDSVRGRYTSDDEAKDVHRERSTGRSRDGDRNKPRERGTFRDRNGGSRDSSSRTRGSGESVSRNSRFSNPSNRGPERQGFMEKRKERSFDSGFRRDGESQGGFVEKRKERSFDSGFKNGIKNVKRESNGYSNAIDSEVKGRKLGGFDDLLSEDTTDDEDSEEDEDDEDVYTKKASSALGLVEEVSTKVVEFRSSTANSDSYLSETRFDQFSISPLSLRAVKDAGYEKMTLVQEATLPVILKGKDVLAKAKTGTGKTVAFLLPSIEVVVKSPPDSRDNKRPPIVVLVICPTRELASQAANEAKTLLKYHPSIGVQVVIGGTRLALEQKRMQANPCQILVATPGRLKDHIENTAGFATRMTGVKVLVLDEADHLLDMGFRKDIERIISAVPKQRQTLLFSATIPQEVRQICHIALKKDHESINIAQGGNEETHSQVTQMHMVAPLDKHFPLLYVLLKDHIADDVDYKVIVFCTTAMVTRLVADLLTGLKLNVREIHSRKPQSYRTRISDEFRKSKSIILVTSDVSARGVDYPDVTLVIQVGVPSDKQQYIHRLGRTGRKGKEGQGILMLAPWEEYFLSSVKDLPITKAALPVLDPATKKKVELGLNNVQMKNKEAAYQAWLGYYNSNKNVGRDKSRLVELAADFSRSMGLDETPAISKQVLGKMGLRNVPGLRSA